MADFLGRRQCSLFALAFLRRATAERIQAAGKWARELFSRGPPCAHSWGWVGSPRTVFCVSVFASPWELSLRHDTLTLRITVGDITEPKPRLRARFILQRNLGRKAKSVECCFVRLVFCGRGAPAAPPLGCFRRERVQVLRFCQGHGHGRGSSLARQKGLRVAAGARAWAGRTQPSPCCSDVLHTMSQASGSVFAVICCWLR